MAVGTWIKRGGGANVLTEDIMTNFGEMAAYGETRVTLERLGPSNRRAAGISTAVQRSIQCRQLKWPNEPSQMAEFDATEFDYTFL